MKRKQLFDLLETDRKELIDIARAHQMLSRDEAEGVSDATLKEWINSLTEDELDELK